MTIEAPDADLLPLVASLVAAHVSKNSIEPTALAELIRSVYITMSMLGKARVAPVAEKPVPAVPVKRSIFPEYIVCLEDGKKLKTLKRHLSTSYGLTPEQYRTRWDLPSDYPMVAPKYAQHRSSLAKAAGLGRTSKTEKSPILPPIQKVPEGVGGRKRGPRMRPS